MIISWLDYSRFTPSNASEDVESRSGDAPLRNAISAVTSENPSKVRIPGDSHASALRARIVILTLSIAKGKGKDLQVLLLCNQGTTGRSGFQPRLPKTAAQVFRNQVRGPAAIQPF
jgi:hypothetical protein